MTYERFRKAIQGFRLGERKETEEEQISKDTFEEPKLKVQSIRRDL